jgi:hypothetical protein
MTSKHKPLYTENEPSFISEQVKNEDVINRSTNTPNLSDYSLYNNKKLSQFQSTPNLEFSQEDHIRTKYNRNRMNII